MSKPIGKKINLMVLGSGGVGKSVYIIMARTKEFIDYYDPTIVGSYRLQECVDGEVTLMDVVDTAGQSEFASMREQYIAKGDGFLLMYSVTDRTSFQQLTDERVVVDQQHPAAHKGISQCVNPSWAL